MRKLAGILIVLAGTGLLFSAASSLFEESGKRLLTPADFFIPIVLCAGGAQLILGQQDLEHEGVRYVGFWPRCLSNLLDMIILLVSYFTVRYFLEGISPYVCALIIALCPLGWGLLELFLLARFGATPGKMILGIKVKKLNLERITIRQAFLRCVVNLGCALAYVVAVVLAVHACEFQDYSALPFLKRLGYLSSFFPRWYVWVSAFSEFWFYSEVIVLLLNRKRRALHDFIAGTVVVHTRRTARAPVALPLASLKG